MMNYAKSSILQQSSRLGTLVQADENSHQIIDVRSRQEYLQGTIPGAVNIPLFDDDERGVIGTLYRHAGQQRAVDKGFEYVEERLSVLVESFLPYKELSLTVFCARGGMRSRSVVNLLTQFGYDAFQLEGGYKKYRHDILQCLDRFWPRLIVIHGLTGTGKTRILQELDNAIDLEDLAQHRSSLFGAIDREPRNQRTFESHLFNTVLTLRKEPFFIEGESRKIGRVFIPKPLAMAMKEGIYVRVDCSMETRIKRIIEDYPV
ncbi:MAG: tRNA 2-selenouridine(34) synthase MnmH, partial [Deltaproteobacteria bacterium]|nr:tRNA 2-selenouridine(34) synthase MnmH [Deltaproteobacteria bacterium]